eukprot:CAMPEP_0203716776 /NCGR_PEP_ID=MMETSP0092-20131115/1403_1 /ASSEMBLY_ACC=CAM_ASM_001090 /TAXON_ID=426623 /ORGANISM="Chaetoceros affinis, Strain CCMP159" /LENGTH=95 /DNA_ID=CAMNT_0050595425 /DNA_START=341 /DNA_END=628 /DNA_ORIENTATION=+
MAASNVDACEVNHHVGTASSDPTIGTINLAPSSSIVENEIGKLRLLLSPLLIEEDEDDEDVDDEETSPMDLSEIYPPSRPLDTPHSPTMAALITA